MVHSTRSIVKIFSIFLLLFLFFASIHPAGATAADGQAKSVAVLPFAMHAPESMAYLQDGLRDMLASRLAANGGAVIVERSRVDSLLEPGKILQQNEAVALAQQLGVNYVVTGSLTSLGGSMSLDAKVLASDESIAPLNFYASAAQENEVIGAINKMSWDIATTVFGATPPPPTASAPTKAVQPAPAAADDPMAAFKTEHPDRALRAPGAGGAGAMGSAFVMNQGIAGGQGFTKTKNFDFAIRAMDVGDIDSDGQEDLVLAGADGIHVILRKDNRLQELAVLPASAVQKVHGISIADLNGNGQAEIYVSANHEGNPSSFGVEWQDNAFTPLFDNAPWYVRVLDLPGEGPTLIGQRGLSYEEPVQPGIFRLLLNGRTLEPGQKLALPQQINLFEFAMGDLNNDGTQEIIALNQDDKLQVFDAGGRRLWQSSEYYGGTSRYIGELDSSKGALYQTSDIRGARIYIPGRIIIADLNGDNLPEVIVHRNISTASRVLSYYKSYTSSEIHALAWNGIALGELWRTRKIDGFVVDYQLTQQKTEQGEMAGLYVGVVLQGGALDILSSKESAVLMYNLSGAGSVKE